MRAPLPITAIISAIGIFLSIGAGVLAGYVTTRTDQTAMTGRLNEHEMRLNAFDRELETQHKEILEYQAEMRATVAHAIDLLTDLKLQIARGGRHG